MTQALIKNAWTFSVYPAIGNISMYSNFATRLKKLTKSRANRDCAS